MSEPRKSRQEMLAFLRRRLRAMKNECKEVLFNKRIRHYRYYYAHDTLRKALKENRNESIRFERQKPLTVKPRFGFKHPNRRQYCKESLEAYGLNAQSELKPAIELTHRNVFSGSGKWHNLPVRQTASDPSLLCGAVLQPSAKFCPLAMRRLRCRTDLHVLRLRQMRKKRAAGFAEFLMRVRRRCLKNVMQQKILTRDARMEAYSFCSKHEMFARLQSQVEGCLYSLDYSDDEDSELDHAQSLAGDRYDDDDDEIDQDDTDDDEDHIDFYDLDDSDSDDVALDALASVERRERELHCMRDIGYSEDNQLMDEIHLYRWQQRLRQRWNGRIMFGMSDVEGLSVNRHWLANDEPSVGGVLDADEFLNDE